MIYGATLLAIFLFNGGYWMFPMVMMFAAPHIKFKWDVPQRWFVVWLVIAFFSCWFSEYRTSAFFGATTRMEGWVTWFILARLAWLYWSEFENLDVMVFCCFSIIMLYFMFFLFTGNLLVKDAFIGSFAAIAAVVLWSQNPALSMLCLPVLIFCTSRAGLAAAISGIAINEILERRKYLIKVLLGGVIIFAPLVYFTPLGTKLSHVEIKFQGARTHWLMEAQDLSYKKPILGYGLDVLSGYLTPVAKGEYLDGTAQWWNRTHNIIWDMILHTGYLGAIAFLFSIGAALFYAVKLKDSVNRTCFSAMMAWLIFGLFNPHGILAHALFLTCLFGMRRDREL